MDLFLAYMAGIVTTLLAIAMVQILRRRQAAMQIPSPPAGPGRPSAGDREPRRPLVPSRSGAAIASTPVPSARDRIVDAVSRSSRSSRVGSTRRYRSTTAG